MMNLGHGLLVFLLIGALGGALVIAFFSGAILLGDDFVGKENGKSTVYGYYTDGGIKEGLKADNPKYFTLNQKEISLHSGSIHYFRVHPQYWRDRLRKLRAAGFLSVETYVPWNLHEPYEGVFDFGDGGEDMSPFLDIRTFLRIAHEEDLLAIIRPGPYICAEWEFGGLPSWLLKYPNMKVRTSDPDYMSKVRNYFSRLLPILRNLQFSTGDGPIIAFQVENEYGNTKEDNVPSDKEYLRELKNLYTEFGLVELFFTSDTPTKGKEDGALPGVLETANFNDKATRELKQLKQFQPDTPSMVMEFWTGWFDHWGEGHHNMTLDKFKSVLEEILSFPSSVNFYMFHGGTSFGFMNGGNVYKEHPFYLPDISSYDYDAPLTEAGDYTEKYYATQEIFANYQKVSLQHPSLPPETQKENYDPLSVESYLDWDSLIKQAKPLTNSPPLYMEELQINMGSGQNFGYIVYRKTKQQLSASSKLQIAGTIHGNAIVLVNNNLRSPVLKTIDDFHGFGYWCSDNDKKDLDISSTSASSDNTVDVVIENWSRNNYGKLSDFDQKRGLTKKQIYIDGVEITNFDVYPLEFKGSWVRNLTGWQQPSAASTKPTGPVLLRFSLTVEDPKDTFVDMTDWGKGIVFVNGFNIGRYATIGPVHSLFIPAPLLQSGVNHIDVFEHFTPASQLKFSTTIIFKDALKTFDTSLL